MNLEKKLNVQAINLMKIKNPEVMLKQEMIVLII